MNRWQQQVLGRFRHMIDQRAPGEDPRFRQLLMRAHAGDAAAIAQIEQLSQNPATQQAFQGIEEALTNSPDWPTYMAHMTAPPYTPPPADVPSSPIPPYATPHLSPLVMSPQLPAPIGVRPMGIVPTVPMRRAPVAPFGRPGAPHVAGAWGHVDEVAEVAGSFADELEVAGAWGHVDEVAEVAGAWGHVDEVAEVAGRWHPHWQHVGRMHGDWPLADPVRVGAAADEIGHWVALVQSALNRLSAIGYRHGGELLQVDGILGPKTKHAVAAFQRAHGLQVDGLPGRMTRTKLAEVLNAHAAFDAPFATSRDQEGDTAAGYVPHPDWANGYNALGRGAERILRMEDLVDRLSPPPPWDSEPERTYIPAHPWPRGTPGV